MDYLDAAHILALEFPGGIGALAKRIGMSPAVLSQKVNRNCKTHDVMVKDALKMQAVAGRADILMAEASTLGYYVLPLPQNNNLDGNLAEAVADSCKEFGEFIKTVGDSMSDGRLTKNELKNTEKELREMIGAAERLLFIMQKENKK